MADLVWSRIGDVSNAIEPFAGSIAWLLARPHAPRVETINDVDCYVTNFWRATQHAPDEVAKWADNPVIELDLHARHRWLVLSKEAIEFREKMRADPDYFDAKMAGWWCWGLCCWIGGGWCTPQGETADGDRKRTAPVPTQRGVIGTGLPRGESADHKKRPRACRDSTGTMPGVNQPLRRPRAHGERGGLPGVNGNVKEQMPTLEQCQTGGKGVNGVGTFFEQAPIIEGRGVNPHGGRPQLADAFDIGRGVNSNKHVGTCEQRLAWLKEWFGRLRDRIRLVRVLCGHWLRVCDSESVTTRIGTVGIFLDPPYAHDLVRFHAWVKHLRGEGPEPKQKRGKRSRDANLYASDFATDVDRLVAEVHVYCVERGTNPQYRIALAGYEGEHDALVTDHGWEVVEWAAQGGYGNRSQKGKDNAKRERLWFSPHCLDAEGPDLGLFAHLPTE